jgi:hypothetical protein
VKRVVEHLSKIFSRCYAINPTAWTVRGSNRGVGTRFSVPVQTGPEARLTPYTVGTGSFPGVKRQVRGFDHPPHLALRLKKEYSCTSTPSLGLRALL